MVTGFSMSQEKSGNNQEIPVMKTELSCNGYRIFPVTGKNELCLPENPGLITGFPCLFPILPCLALQCLDYDRYEGKD